MTFRAYRELLSLPNLRLLVAVQFLTELTFYSTVIVAYQTERGLNYTQMFWMESIIAGAVFLCEVPTGVLADRLGHRRMLLTGQALFLLSHLTFVLARGFWPFALSAALHGVGLAALSGSLSAYLYESLPPGRREELATSAFALTGSAASTGFFSGLTVGSFMGVSDPAIPVVANIAPMAGALLLAFFLRPAAEAKGAPEVAASESPVAREPAALLRTALQILREQPVIAGISLLGATSFTLINAIFWYNQPLFARAAIPVAFFGPLTAAGVALKTAVALTAPAVERRFGVRAGLALASLLPGLAYLAAVPARTPVATAAAVAAVAAGAAWRRPLLQSLLNRRLPDGARATTLSALSFLGTVVGMLLNPLIGWAGDYGLTVALSALGAGLCLLAVAMWRMRF